MQDLETTAMAEKGWHMRGEASAAARPVNSALELDLDYELTLRPPPQPTAAYAQSIEDMVKERVRELRFDNIVRVLPAEPVRARTQVDLDDSKSKAGLADLYEKDFVAATSGTVEDKHARLRSVRAHAPALAHCTCTLRVLHTRAMYVLRARALHVLLAAPPAAALAVCVRGLVSARSVAPVAMRVAVMAGLQPPCKSSRTPASEGGQRPCNWPVPAANCCSHVQAGQHRTALALCRVELEQ